MKFVIFDSNSFHRSKSLFRRRTSSIAAFRKSHKFDEKKSASYFLHRDHVCRQRARWIAFSKSAFINSKFFRHLHADFEIFQFFEIFQISIHSRLHLHDVHLFLFNVWLNFDDKDVVEFICFIFFVIFFVFVHVV